MMDNRTESTNSALKIPLIPRPQPSQPRSQPESLLFNDILEEKTLALRNTLTEFLQVEPYRKFDIEFNNFLTNAKHIIQEGRQNGSNASRLTNLSQISQAYNRPSSFYRPQTTVSTINSNGTTSAFKVPETNYLNKNGSKLTYLQPRIILSRCDATTSNSNNTQSLCQTIVEENQNNSKTTHRNYNDNQLLINESKVLGNVVKFLSMWSVNLKSNKSSSTVFINITGNLLSDDRVTVVEKTHNAGMLEFTKENNLIKTTNGLYRLIGKIIGGSPTELYLACIERKGIPGTWKNILKNTPGINKNKLLNVTLKSPAVSINQTKIVANLNKSLTRSGKRYNINHKTSESTKNNFDVTENNNKRKLQEQTRPLLASTPKKPKLMVTPSQFLKNKFHQKVQNKTNEMSNTPSRINSVNDSITVTKKRQSLKNNKLN